MIDNHHERPTALCGLVVMAVFAGSSLPAVATTSDPPAAGSETTSTLDRHSEPETAREGPAITVTASRERAAPDRQSYDVESPDSGTMEAIDAIARLPGAIVNIDGKLAVLGQTNITYMIDGQYVPPDMAMHLPASLIARIEVIANPGAASGSSNGVVINLVLKSQRQEAAKNLILRAQAGTLGNREVSLTHQIKADRLEVILGLGSRHSRRETTTTGEETFLSNTGQPTGTGAELGQSQRHETVRNGSLLVSHDLAPDKGIVLLCVASQSESNSSSQLRRETQAYGMLTADRNVSASQTFEITDATCAPAFVFAKDGESHFQIALSYGLTSRKSALRQDVAGQGVPYIYALREQGEADRHGLTFKRVRKFNQRRNLEIGLEYERSDRRRRYEFGPLPSAIAAPSPTDFRQIQEQWSAYLSYQFPVGQFGIQPGLRVTHLNLDHLGRANEHLGQTGTRRVLPSLHIDYRIGRNTIVRGAFTRKLLTVSEDFFNPYPIGASFDLAAIGDLSLEIGGETNFELSVEMARKGSSTQVRFYGRNRDRGIVPVWRYLATDSFELRYLNAEEDWRLGLNANFKRSITPRLEVSFDLDIFHQEQTWRDEGLQKTRNTSWTGKWNLNWSIDGNDTLLITGQYADAVLSYGAVLPGELSSSLKYTHDFPQNLSLAFELIDFLASDIETNRYRSPTLLRQRDSRIQRRAARLTVSKRF
ncbi:MAG: TonB-dependent receptor plug domain-containing protein [Novosphingobium sp.]